MTAKDAHEVITTAVASGSPVPAYVTVRLWVRTGSLGVTLPTSDAPVVLAYEQLRAATAPTKERRMAYARSWRRGSPGLDEAADCGAPHSYGMTDTSASSTVPASTPFATVPVVAAPPFDPSSR